MSWLIMAPDRSDDEALTNSSQVARWTASHASKPRTLTGADATRAALEAHIGDVGGVAFFGHGDHDRLFDADRPPGEAGPALLDSDNVSILKGRWFHAFACMSGLHLGELARSNGAAVYVGYRQNLNVSFPSVLPERVQEAFIRVVTSTTFALADGVRNAAELQRAASRAADALVDLLLAAELPFEGEMAVHILSQQLVDAMCVV